MHRPEHFADHLEYAPAMRARFDMLRRRLVEIIGDRDAYFVANPGNAGDGLIRRGTLEFLADAGIRCTEQYGFHPRWTRGCGEAVLLFGGGGGWCRFWDHGTRVIEAAASQFHHTVVLPSTFERVVDADNVTWFARDRFESIEAQPRATFCDDMAFYLKPTPMPAGTGIANLFRGDDESAGEVPIPEDNLDIAASGDHLSDPGPLIDSLARYRHLRTDRLHVAILGALLGKIVDLYPGAYFKNRAVYDSSMRGTFNSVLLC